jgi:hypothetical protein
LHSWPSLTVWREGRKRGREGRREEAGPCAGLSVISSDSSSLHPLRGLSWNFLFKNPFSIGFRVSYVKEKLFGGLWKAEGKRTLFLRGSCLQAYGHWQKTGIWDITLRVTLYDATKY